MRENLDFLREIVRRDTRAGVYGGRVVTRFPPEPNGFLHIGHAKSICINFGIARDYHGRCHLRMDDTNPSKEEQEYIDSIRADVRWLGFDWKEHEYYASDYYPRFYEHAVGLIKEGKAFVCDLDADQMRAYRGTLTEPGRESPFRGRSPEESRNLTVVPRYRGSTGPASARRTNTPGARTGSAGRSSAASPGASGTRPVAASVADRGRR